MPIGMIVSVQLVERRILTARVFRLGLLEVDGRCRPVRLVVSEEALDLLGNELASSSRQRALSDSAGSASSWYGGLLTARPCEAPKQGATAQPSTVKSAIMPSLMWAMASAGACSSSSSLTVPCGM